MPVLEQPGQAWLDAFMQAQARVMAESMFFTFGIGQLGVMGDAVRQTRDELTTAAAKVDEKRAREMIAEMRRDAKDMLDAAKDLHKVMVDMLNNAEQNLG